MERVLVAQAPIARTLVRLFETQFALRRRGAREPRAERIRQGIRARARRGREPRRGPHPARATSPSSAPRCAPTTTSWTAAAARSRARCPSSSIRTRSPSCRCRGRSSRSSSTARASKACTCAWAYVARGGMRWSDRREDFRTEVLGLMKAQNVKNTVIVPVGAKGGFYPKRLPAGGSREDMQTEGIASYQTFIRGLLDVTDNIVNGKTVVRPGRRAPRRRRCLSGRRRRQGHRHVLRHRQRDLDRIRLLARRRVRLGRLRRLRPQGHGHHGARRLGVREAPLPRDRRRHPVAGLHLRRHRRHVGRRVRQRHAALEAHPAASRPSITGTSSSIPNPDAAASFRERERLFKLPRSSWDDYSRKLDFARRRRLAALAPSRSRCRAEAQHAARARRRRPRRRSRSCAPSCACRSTCCGTAASAPT